MLFKKKIKPKDKMSLAIEVKNNLDNIEQAMRFIRAEGNYKLRREVKLTDKEYAERIGMIASDILMTYMKAIVAERIVLENGLFKVYAEQLKEVGQAMAGYGNQSSAKEPAKEPPADKPKEEEKGGPK